ncbi:MAG: bifunctional riboflavin kinase/FAD synthetase [Gammaproteobacteria bacterium]
MQYLKGFQIPPSLQGAVVTLGNFDGVHVGHQIMLQTLVNQAKMLKVPSIVVTFEPQPQEFFAKEKPTRLMTLREKAVQFEALGVDALVILPFNAAFAAMTAESFIETFLKGSLKAKHLVIGHDWRFGAGRVGDIQMLRHAGLAITELAPVMIEGHRVSSTAIRDALKTHDLLKAEKYLGRRYSMDGKVRRGDGRGRQFGFPTANIDPRRVPALRGVFAVKAFGNDGTMYPAVANLGTRPTVCGLQTLLEVHLLDADKALYGERLKVVFMQFIRGEQRFASVEELRAQIAADVTVAKTIFYLNE